eukprot:279453_1
MDVRLTTLQTYLSEGVSALLSIGDNVNTFESVDGILNTFFTDSGRIKWSAYSTGVNESENARYLRDTCCSIKRTSRAIHEVLVSKNDIDRSCGWNGTLPKIFHSQHPWVQSYFDVCESLLPHGGAAMSIIQEHWELCQSTVSVSSDGSPGGSNNEDNNSYST